MENSKKLSYKAVTFLGILAFFFGTAMRFDTLLSVLPIVDDIYINNVATVGFVVTALGLIVFGIMGDKLPPIKMITAAILGGALINILLSFFTNIYIISVLLCLNAIFYSMLLPALIRFFSEQVSDEKYFGTVAKVNILGLAATIILLTAIPKIINAISLRNTLYIIAGLGLAVFFVWFFMCKNIKIGKAIAYEETLKNDKPASVLRLILFAGLIPVFLVLIVEGCLRNGIVSWLPNLAYDMFDIEKSSVISSVIVPALGIIGVGLAAVIYKKLKHEIKTATIMWLVALLSLIVLILDLDMPHLTVVCVPLVLIGVYGANFVLIFLMPKKFKSYGKVSAFAGIFSAFSYIGVAFSNIFFTKVVEEESWGLVLVYCFLLAVFGFLAFAVKIKSWTKFINK